MTRPARVVKKIRVNLDMHPDVKEQVEALKERLNADSMGEVIRRAVAVYQILLDANDGDEMVLLKTKKSIAPARQLILP